MGEKNQADRLTSKGEGDKILSKEHPDPLGFPPAERRVETNCTTAFPTLVNPSHRCGDFFIYTPIISRHAFGVTAQLAPCKSLVNIWRRLAIARPRYPVRLTPNGTNPSGAPRTLRVRRAQSRQSVTTSRSPKTIRGANAPRNTPPRDHRQRDDLSPPPTQVTGLTSETTCPASLLLSASRRSASNPPPQPHQSLVEVDDTLTGR